MPPDGTSRPFRRRRQTPAAGRAGRAGFRAPVELPGPLIYAEGGSGRFALPGATGKVQVGGEVRARIL